VRSSPDGAGFVGPLHSCSAGGYRATATPSGRVDPQGGLRTPLGTRSRWPTPGAAPRGRGHWNGAGTSCLLRGSAVAMPAVVSSKAVSVVREPASSLFYVAKVRCGNRTFDWSTLLC